MSLQPLNPNACSQVANDVVIQQQQPHSSHQQIQQEQQHQQQLQAQQQQQQKQRPTPSARSRRRLAKVLVALAGVFVACWLPYAAALLYTNWFFSPTQGGDGNEDEGVGSRHVVLRLATVAAFLLGHAHSAVNPVVYWWLNRHTLRACPWCWSSDDQFNDDAGFGCGALGCVVSGAVMAFGCGRGDGRCGDGGAVDCGGGTGCRQSQNHTPTRLNRLLFHRQPNNHQRSRQPSSTNEAALGPFNPRFATPKKRPQQLPIVKNPVMLYYAWITALPHTSVDPPHRQCTTLYIYPLGVFYRGSPLSLLYNSNDTDTMVPILPPLTPMPDAYPFRLDKFVELVGPKHAAPQGKKRNC